MIEGWLFRARRVFQFEAAVKNYLPGGMSPVDWLGGQGSHGWCWVRVELPGSRGTWLWSKGACTVAC